MLTVILESNNMKFFQKGSSLVEILISLSIVIVLISITSVAVVTSLSNAQKTKSRSQAQSLAQQAVEVTRQIRDTNWATFDQYNGFYCLAGGTSQLTPRVGSCGLNVDSMFNREIEFTRSSSACNRNGKTVTKVSVIVSWSSSRCSSTSDYCEKVVTDTCFANIYGDGGI